MDRIEQSEPAVNKSCMSHEPEKQQLSGQVLLQISLILLAGIVAYCNSLYGPFHFDDLGITDRSYLWPRAFSKSPRQLTDLTFVLNHLVNGTNVLGYHLVNIAVHLTSALVLYALASSALDALSISFPLTSNSDSSAAQFIRRFLPFATALLFVCHPIQTQSVSYIVQRYTAMAALFYFGSVLAFIRARFASHTNRSSARFWILSILAMLMGLLAMRCKETAYTLPVMLLLVEMFLFRGELFKSKAFVACMTILLVTLPAARIAQHGIGGFEDLLYTIQRSTREELTYSRSNYLLTQLRVMVSYLRLLILPINQNLDYDVPLLRSFFTLPVLASALLHLTILSTSIVLFFRSRTQLLKGNRELGVCQRLISFGIIWFYLALMIESSIFPILDAMFEHRLYLPSAGFFLSASAAAALLATSQRTLRTAVWIVLTVTCGVLTVATIQRNRIWNNDLLLWEDTASKSSNKPRVLANLAGAYLRDRMPQKALPPLIRAIELGPGMTDPLNYLGVILDMSGRFEGRYDNGRGFIVGSRTIDMRYYNAWFANTRNNLGLVYEYTGNYDLAVKYYKSAVTLAPTFELAWYNLFLAATVLKDRQLAGDAIEKLKIINPERARYALLQSESQR